MRRLMAWAAASILAGCSASEDCDDLHEVLSPASGNEPGTLQSGIRFRTLASWAMAARPGGGGVAVTCSGLVMLDAKLRETGRADTDVPRAIAVAPDDAIYAVTLGSDQDHVELVALSPEGKRRWSAPVASASAAAKPVELVAGAEGVYVGTLVPTGQTLVTTKIFGFDAATGAVRTVATAQTLLAAAHSGVLTYEGDGEKSVTLHQLDPAGNVVWSHTVVSTSAGLELRGAVATPDGGAIVLGGTASTLDFGDRTLPVTGAPVSFVAGFDAAGATRWVFAHGMYTRSIAASATGEILIAGSRGGGFPDLDADASLLVATSSGVLRTLPIDGPGGQSIAALAFAPGGLAWMEVNSGRADDNRPAPVMHIGDHTFADDATYLFKVVP